MQVRLDHPQLRWQGDGYFDMNRGDAPIEQGFVDWQWARGAYAAVWWPHLERGLLAFEDLNCYEVID